MKKYIMLFTLIICSSLYIMAQDAHHDIGTRRGYQIAGGSINEKSALTFTIEVDRKGIYELYFEINWSNDYWEQGKDWSTIDQELMERIKRIKLRDIPNKIEVVSMYPINLFYDLFSVCYILDPGIYTFSLEIDAYARVDYSMGIRFTGETTLDMQTKAELFINEQVNATSEKNYVITIVPMDTIKSLKYIDDQLALYGEYSNNKYNIKNIDIPTSIQVQYFDGLGRLEQIVQVGVSPSGTDLISLQEYDVFGRKDKTWLPAVIDNNNGAHVDKLVVVNSAIAANTNNGVADQKPYSKPVYENSSLNRKLEQYAPGQDWHNNGKKISTAYKTNIAGNATYNCILYKVGGISQLPILSRNGNYPSGELFVTELTDENECVSYEFKDKLDRIVLTRQLNGNTRYDTYYVYDNYNNLCFVLPPRIDDEGVTQVKLDELAYQYKYDNRNRCIWKKIPGCEPVYYIYDKADHLIFSQDGEQRLKGEWLFSIPDALGRIVMTGLCSNSLDYRDSPLENIVVTATYNINRTNLANSYTISGVSLSGRKIHSANYYDNYDFRGITEIPSTATIYTPEAGYGIWHAGDYTIDNKFKNKDLLTGNLTAQFNPDGSISSDYLYSVMYYDNKGRIVQVKSNNHLPGGIEDEFIAYNFTGQPVKRKHSHQATGKATQTEEYAYTYDHAGRLLKTTHKLNNGAEVILANNTYDELGRLLTNQKHTNANLKTTYSYNVRSWTKSIISPLFEQILYYNDSYAGSAKQFSGNISAMSWKVSGESSPRGYTFIYDNLSQLTAANYLVNGTTNTNYKTAYSYDKHGNMLTMQRYGNTTATAYGLIDNLTMNYQLTKAEDAVTTISLAESADFKNYSNLAIEYTYDANGAMTKDLNKGISEIRYNSLNLPINMDIKSPVAEARNEYTYSAGGQKLKVVQKWNPDYSTTPVIGSAVNTSLLTQTKTTDYVGNKIYEQGTLKRVLVDGGYIEEGVYYFYLTDHLGNNRIVANQSGTVIQKNHYYPFGMAFADTPLDEKGKQRISIMERSSTRCMG